MPKTERYGLKTVILGNYATGKTSLIRRMVSNKWDPYTETTIGCAFSSIGRVTTEGVPLQFQIWDTAGQERYRSMVSLYYKHADIVMVCVDLSEPKSLEDAKQWIRHLEDDNSLDNRLVYLVGTKADLKHQVTDEQLKAAADEYGLRLHTTSALDGMGTAELLDILQRDTETKWRRELIGFKKTGEREKRGEHIGYIENTGRGYCCYG